jgi:organic radical activating enzyme
MLTVAKIDRFDIVNNPKDDGACIVIWFSGCSFQCEECHNPRLWSSDIGDKYDAFELFIDITKIPNEHKSVVYLGGEPLEQNRYDLEILTNELSKHGYKIWLYTGFDFCDVPKYMLDMAYTIKCGRYDKNQKQEGILASSNQHFYRKYNNQWRQIDL